MLLHFEFANGVVTGKGRNQRTQAYLKCYIALILVTYSNT